MRITTLAVISLLFAGQAQSKPWNEVIADVQTRADNLLAESQRLNAPAPGNHSIEAIGLTHQCAILGRMLSRDSYITPLEALVIQEPRDNMSDDELLDLSEGIKSLYIWINVAENMVTRTTSEKAVLWNEKCVGQDVFTQTDGIITIPAEAQIAVADANQLGQMLECVDSNISLGTSPTESCTGLIYQDCIQQSASNETACNIAENAAWQATLDHVYAQQREIAFARDARDLDPEVDIEARFLDENIKYADLLAQTQTKWNDYKAAVCTAAPYSGRFGNEAFQNSKLSCERYHMILRVDTLLLYAFAPINAD